MDHYNMFSYNFTSMINQMENDYFEYIVTDKHMLFDE